MFFGSTEKKKKQEKRSNWKENSSLDWTIYGAKEGGKYLFFRRRQIGKEIKLDELDDDALRKVCILLEPVSPD
ncbi:unnamed protein product [Wuchereria bancrofti]|uniref:Uncharacterized protein n=1 Tax=Wuchereria bancrofti TaxID=6293 RepID=A0A3P7FIZ7_WUCBA|nr:unnamed protein product [Wuchereria bancrofti]